MVPSDSFNRDLFQDLRNTSSLFTDLPAKWEDLQTLVTAYVDALPKPSLVSRGSPFHSAILNSTQAFRVAIQLIQNSENILIYGEKQDRELVQSSGVQLLLYAVFLQLHEWVEPKPITKKQKLLPFKNALSRISPLRNAIAHQGGKTGSTYFRFISKNQTVEFSSDQVKPTRSVPIRDVILGAFLYWLVASRKWLQCQNEGSA